MSPEDKCSAFPTTMWTEVERTRQAGSPAALQALENIVENYYTPLRAQLVREFHVDDGQASDWLHSFVWKKVMLRNLFAKADRRRGRFRSFLVRSLLNFARDEIAVVKPPDKSTPFHEEQDVLVLVDERRAASSLDKAWARGVLAEVLRRMRVECERKGNERIWEVFRLRLLEPLLDGKPPPQYEEMVERFGFKDEAQAGNALITAKRMFPRVLREVVAEVLHDRSRNRRRDQGPESSLRRGMRDEVQMQDSPESAVGIQNEAERQH